MKVTFTMNCDGYTEDILRRKLTAALDRGAFELGFHDDVTQKSAWEIYKAYCEDASHYSWSLEDKEEDKMSDDALNSNPLSGLNGFDPKEVYGGKPEGSFKRMTKQETQIEIKKISNLITDMILAGANWDELIRAVRHSMVVIDAAKYNLDYRQSEIDNDIRALKNKYQGNHTGIYEVFYKMMEKVLDEIKEEKKAVDAEKENLEESLRLNLEFTDKLKASLENAERSSEFWKSLYNSEKEKWVNRWTMAIQNCRDFGLTDQAVRNLFEINSIGTLDGYIKDVQRFSKTEHIARQDKK